MMPNEEKDYNFVERTQTNLRFITEQINKNTIPINNDKFYEVTNLLNCCLGLVSYVYEFTNKATKNRKDAIKLLDSIFDNYSYSEEKYGIIITSMPIIPEKKKTALCTKMSTLLCHMRNAICHGRIKPIASEPDHIYIKGVQFTDKKFKNAKNDNFDAILSVEQISTFANDVANAYNSYNKK